jgi:hypothetical protein
MRVAIVSKTIVPSGNPSWVAGLARGLQEAGHSVTVVFIRKSRYWALFESDFLGVPVEFCMNGRASRFSEALGWPLSIAFLDGGYGMAGSPDAVSWVLAPFLGRWRGRFDLLVMYEHFTGLSGLISNLLWQSKYAVFLHETGPVRPKTVEHRLEYWLRSAVASRSSVVCALSPTIAGSLRDRGLPRVVVVSSGCEHPVRAATRRERYVLVDGRWTPPRNPFFLTEVVRRTPHISYVLAGSFWTPAFETQFVDSIRQEGLESRISIRTGLTAAQTSQLYDQAMVYLRWAAHGEGGWETGFPMGLRTALAHGCPVLFDKELGCSDILSDDLGESILPHNPEIYANRIMELSGSQKAVQRQSELSYTAAEKHSWATVASRLLASIQGENDSKQMSM